MKRLFSGHRNLALRSVLVATALAVMPAAAAHASVLSVSACDGATLTQPFLKWGDTDPYKLVPGGDFETGAAGWTLTGGAQVVAGSEPYGVTGKVGKSSLYLPAGATAQSPYTCVDAAYPTLRFFDRNGGLLSSVMVQVVYKLPLLGPVALPVGAALLNPTWGPSLPMLTASAVPGLLRGGYAQVALRFTALTGASQIDDVFIDPRMK
jgi:hypothetical protein